MTYAPPEDEFEYHAQLWKAHDSIINSCEGLARQYGLDPVLAENLLEDLRVAGGTAGCTENWNIALARMLEALFPPRDNQ